jgi:predicted transcriptional regulator
MSHTHQSKPHYQSDTELWFQKNNYMAKFLSEESKRIINKIKEKKI